MRLVGSESRSFRLWLFESKNLTKRMLQMTRLWLVSFQKWIGLSCGSGKLTVRDDPRDYYFPLMNAGGHGVGEGNTGSVEACLGYSREGKGGGCEFGRRALGSF